MKTLTRSTRLEFISQFPQFTGKSTHEIRTTLGADTEKAARARELLAKAGWRLPTGEAKAKRAAAIAANAERKALLAELAAL